jgi:hypothetical protein
LFMQQERWQIKKSILTERRSQVYIQRQLLLCQRKLPQLYSKLL